MPDASSCGARNCASTTKVAPCSRCAGPNSSPRKLCAIMMWSQTVSAYILYVPVGHDMTEAVRQQSRHGGREIVERRRWLEQRVVPRVGEQRQRQREPFAAR